MAGIPLKIFVSTQTGRRYVCIYQPGSRKNLYYCSIYYNMEDETELLVQLLSFGPVIRILGPERFLEQVRARVKRQHKFFIVKK